MRRTAFALVLFLTWTPGVTALVLDFPAGAQAGPIVGPTDEPLVLHAAGDLTIIGPITAAPGQSVEVLVDGRLIVAAGGALSSGDGAAGRAATGPIALAGGGQDGGDLVVQAAAIEFAGGWLHVGSGGNGGSAVALGTSLHPAAHAQGGQGGAAGRLEIPSTQIGPADVRPGHGGGGGNATAQGLPAQAGCGDGTGQVDRHEPASMGDGEDAKAEANPGTCGPPDGVGGAGGDAEAYGGDGGPGGSTGNGGDGGDAVAMGGTGGRGQDACFATKQEAEASGFHRAGNGGPGGMAIAEAGDGGTGVFGGAGGAAVGLSIGGNGGNGTFVLASRGIAGDHPGESLIDSGDGGAAAEGGHFMAGNGGLGILAGGAGGAAVGGANGGNGGFSCQISDLPKVESPFPWVGLLPILVAWVVRRRR